MDDHFGRRAAVNTLEIAAPRYFPCYPFRTEFHGFYYTLMERIHKPVTEDPAVYKRLFDQEMRI
jgi:hypothetical protein